jgi:hypothetical protein
MGLRAGTGSCRADDQLLVVGFGAGLAAARRNRWAAGFTGLSAALAGIATLFAL